MRSRRPSALARALLAAPAAPDGPWEARVVWAVAGWLAELLPGGFGTPTPDLPAGPTTLDALADATAELRAFELVGSPPRLRAGGGRKAAGLWYTPPAAVAPALDALPPGTLCDPACGTGHFLVAAARRRLDAGQDPAAVAASLHGLDLDPLAIALARSRLWAALGADPALRDVVADQVRVGDALLGPAPGQAPGPDGFDWAATWPVSARPGFDAIAGNPPFRAGRHADLPRAALFARVPTAEYQLDPYLLFLDRALRLLAPGGRAALVVPGTWLANHRARALRLFVLGQHRLRRVIELPAAAFDAGVEATIAVIERDGPTPATAPVTDVAGRRIGELLFDLDDFGAPAALARRPSDAALLRRRFTRTVGDAAEVVRGVNPYHKSTHTPAQIADRIHHARAPAGPAWRAELRGRHLAPWHIAWPADAYIHYGPWLKEPRDPRFFEGPRVVVRKILGATLIAAVTEAPFVCDQSVYIVRPRAGWDPYLLLACLHSRLVAALLRTRHQAHGALFPQLKVAELRGAPLPPVEPDDPRAGVVAALAREAQKVAEAGGAVGPVADRIEVLVEALYAG
ncbi:MAG: N-6 DNA methylase [bacterium]